ncbi:MAG TPA: hypothetical protein VGF44_10365 [Terriglobales bacterium]|jgi:hypothetical protein
MKSNSWQKCVLAIVLMVSLVTTGCSAQWLAVALNDLPVLTEMAVNIASLVTALQSGQQLNPGEAAAIQNISSEAGRDLNLLQTLYNEYKASPNALTMQKIQDVIITINQNLPALLQVAHIGNAALSGRVTAAVNLILATVNSFAALIPASASVTSQHSSLQKISIPSAKELKRQWNQQVCAPTGNSALDAAFVGCPIR